MRLQKNAIAAAIVAATAFSLARAASAQPDAVHAVGTLPVSVYLAAVRPALELIDVGRFSAQPDGFGEAWASALRAVVKRLKHRTALERIEIQKLLFMQVMGLSAPSQRSTDLGWRATEPALSPWRKGRWGPIGVAPVAIEPATELVGDTRGERALLLGSKLTLPWWLP